MQPSPPKHIVAKYLFTKCKLVDRRPSNYQPSYRKKLNQLEQDAPPKVQEQIRLLDSDELDSKLAAAERLSTMGREAEGAAGR